LSSLSEESPSRQNAATNGPEARATRKFAVLALSVFSLLSAMHADAQNARISWEKLPAIPDPEGFAAPFAGVSGGALIVAGGANIVGDKWREPFVKKWYDSVFVLEKPDGKWRTGFKLPRPLGYGVSVTADDAIYCFGGSDSTQHYAESFRLVWKNGAIKTAPLPPLPQPCANACGALVGRTIYIAGGIETPTATSALHTFWSLDLDAEEPIWRELEPWPGPERMLAVAGEHDGSFYLFSGAKLTAEPDGKPVREFLRDAYRFTPGQGWTRLADLPRAAVAAPSPARFVASLGLLVMTGDDGLNVTFQPVEKHPGFPQNALAYDLSADAWSVLGIVPFSRATVPTVLWKKRVVIPNGEVRPRVRTPEVMALQFP
jgi:N-acetylneuraminic acid mutarotase